MPSQPIVGRANLTHPQADAVVVVRITRGFRLRLWLALFLTRLAVWIAGGEIEEEL